jgi:hypothetical protein
MGGSQPVRTDAKHCCKEFLLVKRGPLETAPQSMIHFGSLTLPPAEKAFTSENPFHVEFINYINSYDST